jgi:alpha-L-fucosidase
LATLGVEDILFLTKHHDGFCLWNTKTTGGRVTASGTWPQPGYEF